MKEKKLNKNIYDFAVNFKNKSLITPNVTKGLDKPGTLKTVMETYNPFEGEI